MTRGAQECRDARLHINRWANDPGLVFAVILLADLQQPRHVLLSESACPSQIAERALFTHSRESYACAVSLSSVILRAL